MQQISLFASRKDARVACRRDALPRVRRFTSQGFFLQLLPSALLCFRSRVPFSLTSGLFTFIGRASPDRVGARPYDQTCAAGSRGTASLSPPSPASALRSSISTNQSVNASLVSVVCTKPLSVQKPNPGPKAAPLTTHALVRLSRIC